LSDASAGPRYKIREEQEVRVADAEALVRIVEGMGLRPCFRYEKYRSAFRLPRLAGLTIDFDETPIGEFLELEGERGAIDRGAALLGFAPDDYIVKSYGALFVEQRQSPAATPGYSDEPLPASGAPDMLFSTRKAGRFARSRHSPAR
jgi:CYTH domain